MKKIEKVQFITFLNSLGLVIISCILFSAYYFQIFYHQVPCPLCLLQRVGLMLAGFGFYFNLRLDFKYAHYALVILSCLLTSFIATRQILLHIQPGDPGYSTVFLGFHFYTWSLITMISIICIVAGIMLISDLSDEIYVPRILRQANKSFKTWVCRIYALLVVIGFILTILESGFGACPENPVSYFMLLS